MRFIAFDGKTPVNTAAIDKVPEFEPWTLEQWIKWLSDSKEHYDHIATLHQCGNIRTRNDYIDLKAAHWGSLKPWLRALSYGKCWFSETKDIFSHYHVEHFRPKKMARNCDGEERDAYWWLAFDYTNYRLCGGVGNSKKGNWFPLKAGSLISTCDNRCEETEVIYFLDPRDAHDVTLIAFDEEGNAIPTPGISQWEKLRAEETITRLKLNEHEALTEGRRGVWQKVSSEIEEYLAARQRAAQGNNPVAKEKLRNHLVNIKNMTKETEELSSVAKWCVLFRNDHCLNRIVA
jgi:uncharacterized protein (TIGR02646 family)